MEAVLPESTENVKKSTPGFSGMFGHTLSIVIMGSALQRRNACVGIYVSSI